MFDLSSRTAGAATVGGYLAVLLLLLVDPSYTVASATAGTGALLTLLVFPVVGLGIGVYTYAEGPYHGVLLFLAATYLGVVGLTLVVGFGLSPRRIVALQGLGLALFVLSLVAILASVKRFESFFGLGALLPTVSDDDRP